MITVSFENDDGNEIEFSFPSRMEVCDDCDGEGFVLCDGMRYAAYSQEEFEESFDENEAREYFTRGGIYDQVCPTCHGKKVVPVINEDALNDKQKVQYKEYSKYMEQRAKYDREYEAECRMERMMGC